MSRMLKIFIAASVLLNLLLAGILVGRIGHSAVEPTIALLYRSLHEMAAALPQDRRQRFEATFGKAEPDIVALRQRLKNERTKAANLLKAEPFDKAAYLAQVKQIQQVRLAIMNRMVDAIVQYAETATPQERATLADLLRHPPPGSND